MGVSVLFDAGCVRLVGDSKWLKQNDAGEVFYGAPRNSIAHALQSITNCASFARFVASCPEPFLVLRTQDDAILVMASSTAAGFYYVWVENRERLVIGESLASLAGFVNPDEFGDVDYLSINRLMEVGFPLTFQRSPFRNVGHIVGGLGIAVRANKSIEILGGREMLERNVALAANSQNSLSYDLCTPAFVSSIDAGFKNWATTFRNAAVDNDCTQTVFCSGGVDSALVAFYAKMASPEARIVTGCTKGIRVKDANEVSYPESAAVLEKLGLSRTPVEIDYASDEGAVARRLDSADFVGPRITYGFYEGLLLGLGPKKVLFSDGTNGDAQYFPEYLYRLDRHRLPRRILVIAQFIILHVARKLGFGHGLACRLIGSSEFYSKFIAGKTGVLLDLVVAIISFGSIYGLQHRVFAGDNNFEVSEKTLEMVPSRTRNDIYAEIVDDVLVPVFGAETVDRWRGGTSV